ncbi:XRE family transcriptional regulator [Neisseria animalis]|uniref:XRE family transcriptional regulator n=1 Tax=Neisseria animalis TaxID=492 RepID=A0A5P3MUQ0_NEIAN|nr:XRE family transcriptional regulator [Neisseria animalis]QEY24795.1 XRE family transcriptional regulator [Neisseria animalis]ROW31535.1 XRE family transcriptional regulator [Neisseria animalis]VEE07695.1 Uncharacterised protein [Neisseria animalis]
MNNYHFTIAVRDAAADNFDTLETAFYQAGCSDALLCRENDLVYLEFDREAANAKAAVYSALADINKAGFHDLVIQESGVCTLAEIAGRAGLSRQAVSLYAQNKRGSGGFPKPLYGIAGHTPLYSWKEAAQWLYRQGKLSQSSYELACSV